MNYVSAVYGVVIFIIVVDWFVRGRREYRGQARRHDDTAVLTAEAERRESVIGGDGKIGHHVVA